MEYSKWQIFKTTNLLFSKGFQITEDQLGPSSSSSLSKAIMGHKTKPLYTIEEGGRCSFIMHTFRNLDEGIQGQVSSMTTYHL